MSIVDTDPQLVKMMQSRRITADSGSSGCRPSELGWRSAALHPNDESVAAIERERVILYSSKDRMHSLLFTEWQKS